MTWNRCVGACALVGAVLAFQGLAHAAIETGSRVKLSDSVGSGPGGQFTVTYHDGPGGFTPFQTFCLEKNETIAFNTPYYVTLEPNALNGAGGSLGPVGNPYNPGTFNPAAHGDPVGGDALVANDNWGDATQWLFQYFTLNQLDLAVGPYVANQTASADALQRVIWYLQQEIASISGTIENALLTWAFGKGDYTGLDASNPNVQYSVMAMNLWGSYNITTGYSNPAQSQLVLIETARSIETPEPMSVAIWSVLVGVGSIVAWRKRR
jgi:hypothetical protein